MIETDALGCQEPTSLPSACSRINMAKIQLANQPHVLTYNRSACGASCNRCISTLLSVQPQKYSRRILQAQFNKSSKSTTAPRVVHDASQYDPTSMHTQRATRLRVDAKELHSWDIDKQETTAHGSESRCNNQRNTRSFATCTLTK